MVVRDLRGVPHDNLFSLAREAVLPCAASRPGNVHVLSSVGTLVTAPDTEAFSRTFAITA